MKKIIHLSDLHFGTERPGSVEILAADIKEQDADLIVVSGDLTQRATARQFQMAKNFLQALGKDVVCVPGNHDIPLYNIVERLILPYRRYRKWIAGCVFTHYVKENLAVLGINSTTPYKPMGGYVTKKQRKMITDFFNKQPKDCIKIMVMHHNLIRSERHKILNQAEKIIAILASCNASLVLSGHIHYSYIELLKRNYFSHNMYVVTAGTPISSRTIAPNSYNVLEVDKNGFKLIVRTFDGDKFTATSEKIYPL